MAQQFLSEKKSYSKDSVVILQGSDQKEINLLTEGVIEIKRSRDNVAGLDEEEIVKKSRRIQLIQAPTIFGVENLISGDLQQNSYIALTDCKITKYGIESNDYSVFFRANCSIALNVLSTLKDYALRGINQIKKFVKMTGNISKINDNFELLYCFINKDENNNLYKKFIENGGVFPSVFEPNFLLEDFSTILEVGYEDPEYDPNAIFDVTKLEFYHNLLKSKPEAFTALINANQNIFNYIYGDLSLINNMINIELENKSFQLEETADDFFKKKDSPLNRLVDIAEKIKQNENAGPKITMAIASLCKNVENNIKTLVGVVYPDNSRKYEILTKYSSQSGDNEAKVVPPAEEKYKKLLKDSAKKIVGFSTLSNERKEAILKNVSDMKKINMNDPTTKESRQIIRKLQDDFFELYSSIFIKLMEKHRGEIPIEIKLFIYFAFIDEKLVTEDQAEFLYNSTTYFTKPFKSEFPIISFFDYLKLIYEGTEAPSMTEVGELFSKIVKKAFTKNEKVIKDTPAGRAEFEINNMARSAFRITSDNLRAYIPYINQNSFKGPFSRIFLNPKKLEQYIEKIRHVNYTLFFRETTWKIPGKSELIKKEVLPYLILVPNSGQRVQMWQEVINNIRASRGRFIVPVFFNGDLNKSLIMACAHFTWELCKTVVGSNWMDPTEGGLVGAYYDYSQFYDKYKDLSIEAKELIKAQFMRVKIDRDRFAYDFYEWLEFERKGVPKLNKIVRGIFYRYIPFPKEIRENLANLPLYSELDNKFNNIRNREFRSLESRYHKYMNKGELPEDLRLYLEMMQK
ncbi:MAG TPA: hypothetical protein PK385_12660 [Spirochaetota bacterium]|nr:hypothetical protein [Spirochaetota bacterium]HOS33960.1 hypothetical protein [Spirochaetota bacterium]HOS56894.1 hypothetical protein [Spirochaetota bacterium]HPK62422.1 hypothetical protein [Spirochaetota bacterium]HQF79073.1 hypothetical protein [Spirochaetota bacterium]